MSSPERVLRQDYSPLQTYPERDFSLTAFKLFLEKKVRLDKRDVEKYGAELFGKTTVDEIVDFLKTYLEFDEDVAMDDARRILRYERQVFLQGLALQPSFLRRHGNKLLNAQSRQEIFSILESHIPSISDSQLVLLVQKIANKFGLAPQAKNFLKKEPALSITGLGQTDRALGDEARRVLNEEYRKQPKNTDEILAEAALTPEEKRARGVASGELRVNVLPGKNRTFRPDFANEGSVIVDPDFLSDEPTDKNRDFGKAKTAPRLLSLGAISDEE